MGLIADCVFTELGLLTSEKGHDRVVQTLQSIIQHWPKETHSGFLVHFTNQDFKVFGEFSTVDTAELAMGALFAGNYFGGEVENLARQLASSVSWSAALKSAHDPLIYPVVDELSGNFSGAIRPFNEYYIVSYIAKLISKDDKSTTFFETFFGTEGAPVGYAGHPVHKNYWGYDLLTDNPNTFMSSFIPQFCYYLCNGFHTNTYYAQNLFPAWLKADMKFWSLAMNETSNVKGVPVKGRLWGCGAGPSPTGYGVDRIDERGNALVASAAIMAGFLGATDQSSSMRSQINKQLNWLFSHNVCTYTKPRKNGADIKVLWRCSPTIPNWQAPTADSIDFSTMVLGYATNFLPASFFQQHTA